ncbi:PepSY-associated TM helix domain-containing protein [Rubritalea spongiae]|uniref:PepSY-associated TM helix domain-containing protein n=1 Tax=Rubritalea spongiae TaxID=430797 RepID=A0ABW5E549_9BACT
MKKKFFHLHKRLAPWIAIPVILWAVTGVLHPIMANWLRPSIANFFLVPKPVPSDPAILSPAEALSEKLENVHQLNLISIDNTPVYRGALANGSLVFYDAQTGEPLANAAEKYAEQLARAYLDDPDSPLISISEITEFGANYSYINRLLPVQRVKLDRADGMEVVVDLRTGKLATFDSPFKRLFAKLFSWGHTWSFLGNRDSMLRISVVLIMSLLSLTMAITGIVNLVTFRVKRKGGKKRTLKPSRKFHRILGAGSALFFLMFSISGIYHVAAKYDYDDSSQWISEHSVPLDQLVHSPREILSEVKQPVHAISLAMIGDQAHYRLALMDRKNRGANIYLSAKNLSPLENGETIFATQLACEFSGYSPEHVSKVEPITSFQRDYGFIFKRLPVVRVRFDQQAYWHYTVDTINAHMAMRTKPSDLVETISFINLHKFHFLDPISKELRDYVTAIAAASIALVSILGLILLRKRRKS